MRAGPNQRGVVAILKLIRINNRIRAKEVRVIGPNSEQLGVHLLLRALELAAQYELDLVEVAPTANPPVCRIMDFSKYKYDQEKKERRVKRHQKISHLKQLRIKPHINQHDYGIKLKQAIGFLNKKDKVKVNLFFQGREMAYKDRAKEILDKFVADTAEVAIVEKGAMLEGRVMSVVLAPRHDKPLEKTKADE